MNESEPKLVDTYGSESIDSKAQRQYKIITPEEVEQIKESFSNLIKYWHEEFRPKYVFLNETSAIPWGYVLKAIWKKAYPSEEVPRFFRINPQVLKGRRPYQNSKGRPDGWLSDSWLEYINKRIDDKDAKIAVYDEWNGSGESSGVVINKLKEPFTPSNQSYDENQIFLETEGHKGEIRAFSGSFRFRKNLADWHMEKGGAELDSYRGSHGAQIIPTHKVTEKVSSTASDPGNVEEFFKGEKVKFTANLIKDDTKRREALDYIHDLKLIGNELGEAIRAEETQKGK